LKLTVGLHQSDEADHVSPKIPQWVFATQVPARSPLRRCDKPQSLRQRLARSKHLPILLLILRCKRRWVKIKVIASNHLAFMLQPMQLKLLTVYAQKAVLCVFHEQAHPAQVLKRIQPLFLIPKAVEETLRD
jgi:hypothetical protein